MHFDFAVGNDSDSKEVFFYGKRSARVNCGDGAELTVALSQKRLRSRAINIKGQLCSQLFPSPEKIQSPGYRNAGSAWPAGFLTVGLAR
jgi:hypothetical protein